MVEYTEAISAEIIIIHQRELDSPGYEALVMLDPAEAVKKALGADDVIVTGHKVFKRDEFHEGKAFKESPKGLHSRYDAAIEYFESVIEDMKKLEELGGYTAVQALYETTRAHYVVAIAALKACRDVAHAGNP